MMQLPGAEMAGVSWETAYVIPKWDKKERGPHEHWRRIQPQKTNEQSKS
jgi:hypothetical protein